MTTKKSSAPVEKAITEEDILSYDEIDELYKKITDLEELVIVRIALMGGLRLAEILDLEGRDLDLDRGALLVRKGKDTKGKKDKTGTRIGKERYAPVDLCTISLIRCLIASRDTGEFKADRRIDKIIKIPRRTVQRHISSLMPRNGLSIHSLRHTAATMQLECGINLMEVRDNLGHTDVKITQQYLHLDILRRAQKYRDAMRTR